MKNVDSGRMTFFRPKGQQPSPTKRKSQVAKLPIVRRASQQEPSNYIMGKTIGEGGFGRVRLCRRRSDGLEVVIKSIDKFRLTTQEKRKAVKREVEIMDSIKHESIISIIDYFQNKEAHHIVMQHFSRTSILQFAPHRRPFSDQTLRHIVRQLAEALAYLHSRGIAHRDIKPENILVNSEGDIKVIDLGLSVMSDQNEAKVAGTPYYMSPQLLAKKAYDPFKADIWAMGVLVYWLVLGYMPQSSDISSKKRSHKALFQLHFPVDMHPGIEYLITKMLNQDPKQRVSAQEILADTWLNPKDFKNEITRLLKIKSTVSSK